jgi:hypothetical protein
MINNITMRGKDAISAKLAECFVTVNTKRYNFMQMISLETRFAKNKITVPILGKTGEGNKSTGWSGTGSATCHYNQSIMRQLAIDYKNTGEDTYFEIQVTNEDPTSKAGRQTLVYLDCNFDNLILSKFNADGEYLDEDMDFTFEDFKMPESFSLLAGM